MVAQQAAAGLLVAGQTGAVTLAWHKSPRSGPARGRANKARKHEAHVRGESMSRSRGLAPPR